MELKEILSAIDGWPAEERLQLMEQIWDGLIDEGFEPELTQELKDTLDCRLSSLDADPDNVTSWEAIKRHARRSR